MAVEYVGNKISASISTTSNDPGFYYILLWLESLGYTAATSHVRYTSDRAETSPGEGMHFLLWKNKPILLQVKCSDPSAMGSITRFITIKVLGGNRSDVDNILEE